MTSGSASVRSGCSVWPRASTSSATSPGCRASSPSRPRNASSAASTAASGWGGDGRAWGPTAVHREAIEALFRLAFSDEGTNIVLVGPNGVGKTMIGKNLAHAVIKTGKTAKFTTASAMLNELVSQDGSAALQRAFRRYTSPGVLMIDELGYVAYGNRHADVLFEVVNRRYESGRSVIVTTNRAFTDWGDLFPNATCVVPLVDRLVHHCEIIQIEGESYRLKEARERASS